MEAAAARGTSDFCVADFLTAALRGAAAFFTTTFLGFFPVPEIAACSFCFLLRYSRSALAGFSPRSRAIRWTWNSANFCLRSGVHAFEIARFWSAVIVRRFAGVPDLADTDGSALCLALNFSNLL